MSTGVPDFFRVCIELMEQLGSLLLGVATPHIRATVVGYIPIRAFAMIGRDGDSTASWFPDHVRLRRKQIRRDQLAFC